MKRCSWNAEVVKLKTANATWVIPTRLSDPTTTTLGSQRHCVPNSVNLSCYVCSGPGSHDTLFRVPFAMADGF